MANLHSTVILRSIHEIFQGRPPLNRLESSVFNCVLFTAINKLSVGQTEGLLPEDKDAVPFIKLTRIYQPMSVRVDEKVRVILPEDEIPDHLLLSYHVQKHLLFIVDVLQETVREIDFQGTYSFLDCTLCLENLRQFDNITLKQETADSDRLVNYLNEEIKKLKETNAQIQQFLESSIPCLNQGLNQVWVQEKTAEEFNRVQQETVVERNALQLKSKENTLLTSVNKLILDSDEEVKVHHEIEKHLKDHISELTNKVDYWTERYNKEIEQLDTEILHTKSKMDELTTKVEELQKVFNRKQNVMNQLQAEADERDRLEEERLKMTRAVLVLQRWWRRIMFANRSKKKALTKAKKPKKGKK